MREFYEQYRFNVEKGPLHEEEGALPESSPATKPVKLIAYYLPQFHRVPENDAWWSPGFTDWRNVTKAVPRYLGHQQPQMPADLGFYDLSHVEVLRAQADLARRAGIGGFCIHHYWFDGRRILEKPLDILLGNPHIDLNFCLCWANENWSRRWDGLDKEILLQQQHSPEDDLRFAESLLPAFRDPRYIRISGRPLLMVYRPKLLPDARATVRRWRKFFVEQGVGDPYIIMPQADEDKDPRVYEMDAAAGFPPHNGGWLMRSDLRAVKLLDPDFVGDVRSYTELRAIILGNQSNDFRLHPGVCPGWDNEARRPGKGISFYGSTPLEYSVWLRSACEFASEQPQEDERLVFINAWNEWAEGAHLEPDLHYGYAFLTHTRRVLDGMGAAAPEHSRRVFPKAISRLMHPQPSFQRRVRNRLAGRGKKPGSSS